MVPTTANFFNFDSLIFEELYGLRFICFIMVDLLALEILLLLTVSTLALFIVSPRVNSSILTKCQRMKPTTLDLGDNDLF